MKLDTINAIVRSLNNNRVKYLVVGGVAVVAHGYGRLTYDLDLVIKLTEDNISAGFRALEEMLYRPSVPVTAEQFSNSEIRNSWIRDKGMTVLNFFSDIYRDTPVDIFVVEPFDFDKCYEVSIKEEIFSGNLFQYVDIATLIEMKRVAGREKDKDDILHLKMIEDEMMNGNK
jgi:hypothetical protein